MSVIFRKEQIQQYVITR